MAASQRSAAAGRTPAPVPWRRRSRPTAATSTPTSTASIPPTRASSRARASSTMSPTRKCSNSRASAPRCSRRARSDSMKMGVRVQVLSSFVEGDEAPAQGTMNVSDEEIEEHHMEQQMNHGIAHDQTEAKHKLTPLPAKPDPDPHKLET